MKTTSTAVALIVSAAFCAECIDLTTKDGVTYKNAKLVKVEKKTGKNSYFKIVHSEGSKLVNPVDIKLFEITLSDGTVVQKIKVMDIMKDGISIYDSKSVRTIKFKDISPESREMFEYNNGVVAPKVIKPPKEDTEEEVDEEILQEKEEAIEAGKEIQKDMEQGMQDEPAPEAAPETKPIKSKNKPVKKNEDTE